MRQIMKSVGKRSTNGAVLPEDVQWQDSILYSSTIEDCMVLNQKAQSINQKNDLNGNDVIYFLPKIKLPLRGKNE